MVGHPKVCDPPKDKKVAPALTELPSMSIKHAKQEQISSLPRVVRQVVTLAKSRQGSFPRMDILFEAHVYTVS
jgi:hypothetical protein